MSAVAILYMSIYFGVVLALLTVMVFGFGFAIDIASRAKSLVVAAVFPIICIAIVGTTVLANRNLMYADIAIDSMAEGSGAAGGWLSRILTLALLGLCTARVVAYLLGREGGRLKNSWLLIGFYVFVITNSITNAAFGTEGGMVHQHFYPLVLFTALYVARGDSSEQIIAAAKWSLVGVMVLSLVAAVVSSKFALQPYAVSFIPSFKYRLWGVASHANALAPMSLLLLLLDLYLPSRTLLRRVFIWTVALIVLVLAQSKTTWVAAILSLGVIGAHRLYFVIGAALSGRSDGNRSRYIAASVLVILIAVCGVLLILLLTSDPIRFSQSILSSKQAETFENLSGRNVVWDIALREWRRNPMFGYGPAMWGAEFRYSIGMGFAFSAHSQFMQSLGAAGTVGFLGLVFYLAILVRAVALTAKITRGVTLGLFVFILVRCIAEVPFLVNTVLNGEVFSHLIVFFILAICAERSLQQRAVDRRGLSPARPGVVPYRIA